MRLNKSLLILLITLTSIVSLFADDSPISKNDAQLSTIHSNEVRSIMRQLKLLNYDREHTDLEIQKLNLKQVQLLSDQAKALIKIAENIPNINSLKNLNNEERVIFSNMANRLYDVTHKIKEEKENNEHIAWNYFNLQLQKTCNTCHQLFRDR